MEKGGAAVTGNDGPRRAAVPGWKVVGPRLTFFRVPSFATLYSRQSFPRDDPSMKGIPH